MPTDTEKLFEAYQKDSRIACQYGTKCYQKNPAHHERYKHPPSTPKKVLTKKNPTKRKINSKNGPKTKLNPSKLLKNDDDSKFPDNRNESLLSSSSDDADIPDVETIKITKESQEKKREYSSSDSETVPGSPDKKEKSVDEVSGSEVPEQSGNFLTTEAELISELFLVKMPEDFFKFYEFCCTLSKDDPSMALRVVELELVGPFDVLAGKIKNVKGEKEAFLRHWRYFYDPPEFQTILKGNDKDGLHYGYWRDEPNQMPVFVAKNSSNKDCKIIPSGPNIFSVVLMHMEEFIKKANPFVKSRILKMTKDLKTFAGEQKIILDKISPEMKERERQIVTKTFHGAGIVVKYDRKTQLGYRNLAATDSEFRKILKKVEEASSDAERNQHLSSVEEIVRWATIAADECDFGTPLELGHDLFSSGIQIMEKTALRMLKMAYSLINRTEFIKIAEAHLKNRKKDTKLSVL